MHFLRKIQKKYVFSIKKMHFQSLKSLQKKFNNSYISFKTLKFYVLASKLLFFEIFHRRKIIMQI